MWLDSDAPAELREGPAYVHGDSAGGNLALVAALRHPGRFAAAALIYPFLDPTAGFDSYLTATDGFDPREAAWYWQQYAASPDDLTHPDLAPLLSDRLGTLPPTLVVTAEHDPLRDEGEHLAQAGRRGRGARGLDPLPRPGARLLAASVGLPGGRGADGSDGCVPAPARGSER